MIAAVPSKKARPPWVAMDWRADAWLLERRARKLYGKPEAAKEAAGSTHVTVNNFVTINEVERTGFQMRERAALEQLGLQRN